MRKFIKMSLTTAMVIGIGSVSAYGAEAEEPTIKDAYILGDVKVKGEIRPRYEMVDEDNAKPNANAFTNRFALGIGADFGTDWISAYIEATDVRSPNDNYNDKEAANGTEANSVVVDPEQFRVTEAYIDLKYGETKLRVGRQGINLDNQRFVGTVNWRQMPQTFDAVTLSDNSIKDLELAAVYVNRVNRVHSERNNGAGAPYPGTNGYWNTNTLLLNGAYKVMDELKVTAYAYMIGSLHDTYGVALTGKLKVNDDLKVSYRAEYAKQDDSSLDNSGWNEGQADADYMNFELGMNMGGILAGAGYEVLSGVSGTGETSFTTPLATLHAKNGWADMFLLGDGVGAGNTNGLEDISLYVGYKSKSFGLAKVIYHDFSSEVGSTNFGTEIDALYKRAIPGVKGLTGVVKFADYNSENYGVDTQKLWLMLDYKFSL